MPNVTFDVTPEELKATATRLTSQISEFTKEYQSIYTAVQDLRVTFKGQASDVFNQKLEGYKNDFTQAESTLKQFVDFLNEYASSISGTESGIVQAASALSSGK